MVRISFVLPNLDLWINCKSRDLEAFVYTVEVVKDVITVLPPACPPVTHEEKLHCVCHGPNFSQYKRLHVTDCDCPFSVSTAGLCAFCSYHLLKYYNGDDARRINNTWKTFLEVRWIIFFINFILAHFSNYWFLFLYNILFHKLISVKHILLLTRQVHFFFYLRNRHTFQFNRIFTRKNYIHRLSERVLRVFMSLL